MQYSAFEVLKTPIWIYDIQKLQILWANPAALELCQSPTLADLRSHGLEDISASTRDRLQSYLERFQSGQTVQADWTFYLQGQPVAVPCVCSGWDLDDGRLGILVEGQSLSLTQTQTETQRAVEVLRHGTGLVSLFTPTGELLLQNPAALAAYGSTPPLLERFITATTQQDVREAIAAGHRWQGDCRVKTRRGIRWHRLALQPIIDPVTRQAAVLLNETDISDRKAIEGVLQETAEHHLSVFTAVTEGLMLQEASGQIVACNASAEAILGLSPEQMMGQISLNPDWQAIHEDGTPFIQEDYPTQVTLRTGKPQTNVVMGVRKPNGNLTWIAVNSQPICRGGDILPYAVVASFIDITARKQMEDQLRAASHRLQTLLTVSPAVIYTLHPDQLTRPTFVSDNLHTMTGYSPQAVMTTLNWLTDCVVPEDQTALIAKRQQWLATGAEHHISAVYRLRCADNRVIWVDDQLKAVRDQSGALVELVGAITDITKQLEVNRRLERISRLVPGMIYQYRLRPDGSSYFPYASEGIQDIYGVTPATVQEDASFVFARLHPQDIERVRQSIQTSAQTLTVWECEYRVQHPTKQEIWVSGHATPQSEPDGSILWHGYIQDVTERKVAEASLRHSEATNRAMLEAIPDLLIRLNRRGARLDFISGGELQPWQKHLASAPRTVYDFLPRSLADQQMYFVQQALETGERQVYQHTLEMGGYLRHEETRIVPINADEVLVMVRDVTDRIKAEMALRYQAHRDRLMRRVTQRLTQYLDLQEILDTTVAEVRQLLQTDRVLVQRFDANQGGVVIAESVDQGWPSLQFQPLAAPCFWLQDSLREGTIQAIADIHQAVLPDGCRKQLAAAQVQAHLVIPIGQGDTVWGLLVCQHCSQPREWSVSDIDLLTQLANQLAIAIQQSELYQQLQQVNQELKHLATHDKLTQLANRRYFDDYLEQEWQRLSREEAPLALILCDIDHFKRFNDAYGHIAGDDCLMQVARVITQAIHRPADLAARYGGEEFAIILPNTPLKGAIQRAQTIRQAIAEAQIPHLASLVKPQVTLSLGVACVYPGPGMVPQQLTALADSALYQAKKAGRDRYCIAE